MSAPVRVATRFRFWQSFAKLHDLVLGLWLIALLVGGAGLLLVTGEWRFVFAGLFLSLITMVVPMLFRIPPTLFAIEFLSDTTPSKASLALIHFAITVTWGACVTASLAQGARALQVDRPLLLALWTFAMATTAYAVPLLHDIYTGREEDPRNASTAIAWILATGGGIALHTAQFNLTISFFASGAAFAAAHIPFQIQATDVIFNFAPGFTSDSSRPKRDGPPPTTARGKKTHG